jgi:two-component system, NarL family, response regulator NreC
MGSQIRILIVDDHAVLRAGLSMLLNAEEDMLVIAESADAEQALQKVLELKPDVVLVDISMPGVNGLDLLKEMKGKAPDSKFLILTMHNDEGYLRIALSTGASGYVLKQAANNELLSAIRVVSQGGTYLHSMHKSLLFENESQENQDTPSAMDIEMYHRLSPREKEIFRLIAMGYTNRQAAEELYLSEKTIETYKSRLMTKLGLHSRIELVRYSLRLGVNKT